MAQWETRFVLPEGVRHGSTRNKNENNVTGETKTRHWAIYVRVSTQEQSREGVSLDAQEGKCRLALRLETDGEDFPVRVYREEGESGKSLERPRVLELLRDVELGKVHGVICFSLDRLSRSIQDFQKIFALCERHGTKIISVSQKFDTSTPTGRLCLNILMCFAQFEREAIVDRITTAVRHLRKKGHWTGGKVPFGYRLDRNAEGRCLLVPHPDQASVVKKMFQLVIESRSLAATARVLRRMGCKRPGGKPFDVATVDRMVRNRTYVGQIACKITKKKDGKTITVCEYVEGKHKALISRRLFDAVARVAYRKSKVETGAKKADRVFPLQGLLYCSHCRMAFSPSFTRHRGRKKEHTYYYRCLAAAKQTQEHARCPFHYLNADYMEAYIVRAVADMADDRSGWLEEICRRIQADKEVATSHLEVERRAILKERQDAAKELDNLTAFIKRAGVNAPLRLLQEISRLERKAQALDAELLAKEREIRDATPAPADPDKLRAVFKRMGELLEQATPEEQHELLRLFLKRIDVTEDGLVLHVYELPEDPSPQDWITGNPKKDLCSQTNLEWWR